MAIFKCKMCGGNLEAESGMSVGTCDSCGMTMTLPKLGDDKRTNLYNRANHFRRNNEYDKAAALYETILNEDGTDAEAYWSLVLCKYGVEYVEDPKTHKRVPTCNRAQMASVFADEDYKSAIGNADGMSREIYEAEAKAIDAIQRKMLEISRKETSFDIFICYKETDERGKRTPDSVLANDLYHQLAREGFKVFFSRITLEDKIGTAYEPYIFAALQSAKVMVALGTKKENFESVWVKNEWSRYLALIKSGADKTLVPAYKDMDPYDLPEEFSRLQALDMSKLGFMQDLIHGIKKLAGGAKQTPPPANAAAPEVNQADSFIRRALISLESGDLKKADEFLNQALIIEPQNEKAILIKLENLFKRLESDLHASEEKAIAARNTFVKQYTLSGPTEAGEQMLGKIDAIIADYDLKARTVDGFAFDTREQANEAKNELANAKKLLAGLDYEHSEEHAIEAKKRLDGYETKFAVASEHLEKLKKRLAELLAGFDKKARTVICGGAEVILETREEAVMRRSMPVVLSLEETYQKYLEDPKEAGNLLTMMKNPDIGVKIHDAYAKLICNFNEKRKKTLKETLKKIDIKVSGRQLVINIIGNIVGLIGVRFFLPHWIFPDWLTWSWFGWKSVVSCLIWGVPFAVFMLAGMDLDDLNDLNGKDFPENIPPNPAVWMPAGTYWIVSGLILYSWRAWMGKSEAGFNILCGIGCIAGGIWHYRKLKKNKRDLSTYEKEEEFFKPFDRQ